MTTVSDPTQQIFELPAVLDFKAATPLAQCLSALRGASLAIDASRVERIGAQCLQVLLSAKQSWSADNTALSLTNPSPAFTEGLRLMGFTQAEFASEEPQE